MNAIIVKKMRYRRTRRVFALVLLAVLTIFCVLNLSKEQVSARQALIQPSFLTSQNNKADSKASELDNQGQELYEVYQFSEAIKLWQRVEKAYIQLGNTDGVAKTRINIAEALQALGLYPRACDTLLQAFNIADLDCRDLSESNANKQDSLIKTLEQLPNSQTNVVGLRAFGNIFQKLDNLGLSQQVLQLSLNAAKALNSPEDESAALLSLGNTFQSWGDRTRASQSRDIQNKLPSTPWRCSYSPSLGAPRKFYQQADVLYQHAATTSISSTLWIQAQINRLSTLLETNALSEAQGL